MAQNACLITDAQHGEHSQHCKRELHHSLATWTAKAVSVDVFRESVIAGPQTSVNVRYLTWTWRFVKGYVIYGFFSTHGTHWLSPRCSRNFRHRQNLTDTIDFRNHADTLSKMLMTLVAEDLE